MDSGGKLTQMGSRRVERTPVPNHDLGERTCPLHFFACSLLSFSITIFFNFFHHDKDIKEPTRHDLATGRHWEVTSAAQITSAKNHLRVHLVCVREMSDHKNAFVFSHFVGAAGRDGLVG